LIVEGLMGVAAGEFTNNGIVRWSTAGIEFWT
jgi:hypothetical protein